MESNIITSRHVTLFTGYQLLGMHTLLFGMSVLFSYRELGVASILVWMCYFLKKKKEIDVLNKAFKDGPFSKYRILSESGYVSILRKITTSSKKINKDGLQLLFIENNQSTHLYTAENFEDLRETALFLGQEWECGVFEVHSKSWLLAK
jgi:hypothetical protein